MEELDPEQDKKENENKILDINNYNNKSSENNQVEIQTKNDNNNINIQKNDKIKEEEKKLSNEIIYFSINQENK